MLRSALLVAVLAASGPALAQPTAAAPGEKPEAAAEPPGDIEVYGEVLYNYELASSKLARERVGAGADPTGATPTVSDLQFQSFRHTITPRLQVGVFRDTFLYAALPIVITQARELTLADGVTRDGSSTVRDGLLPADGFDARDAGTAPGGDMMFRGPARRGLDQIHIGLGFAPMNELRDTTKPTWKLGAEARVSIGQIMAFDRMRPDDNHGISSGVHELRLWTTFSKKLGWAQPWVDVWWLTPIAARTGSAFDNPGFGATNTNKSQQAGIAFGMQVYAVDNTADKTRISIDLGTRVVGHFEGREYTEMWEAFAYAGDSRTGGPLILDADPIDMGVQPLSHPGISNIENYLETAGRFGLRAQIGPHVKFGVTADIVWKTDHAISFADAGVDRTSDDDDLVNPGTNEVNPLHSSNIDLVGHRYLSIDNFDILLGVDGQILF